MLNIPISFQVRTNGYINRGYCDLNTIEQTLREFEVDAKYLLKHSDPDIKHVVYAARYMPNKRRKEVEYHFYMEPMTDEAFEQRVVDLKDARIYALHR